ncbi:hypothetical protein ACLOJK_024165, partial [Asimina triloba]
VHQITVHHRSTKIRCSIIFLPQNPTVAGGGCGQPTAADERTDGGRQVVIPWQIWDDRRRGQARARRSTANERPGEEATRGSHGYPENPSSPRPTGGG